MDFFLYCIVAGWIFIIIINYRVHVKLLRRIKNELFHILSGDEPLKNRRYSIIDRRYHEDKKTGDVRKGFERRKLTFSAEYSKKEDFRRFLNLGVWKYGIINLFQVILVFIGIFLLSYFLEYFHFPVFGEDSFNLTNNWPLFVVVFIFLNIYIWLKIKSFSKIIDEYTYSKH